MFPLVFVLDVVWCAPGAAEARKLLLFGRRGSVGRDEYDNDHDDHAGGRGSPDHEGSPVAAEEGDNLNSSSSPEASRQHHRNHRYGYRQGCDESSSSSSRREVEGRQIEAGASGGGLGLEMSEVVRPMFVGHGRPDPA